MAEILLGNIKGQDGKDLKFTDLTPEQKQELKGEQGEQGLTPKLRLEENGDLYVDYVKEV